MAPSRIVVLAAEIQANTLEIDRYLTQNQLAPLSFEEDAPLRYNFPPNIAAAQEALSAALDELWWLNAGGVGTVFSKTVATSVGLKTILKYKIHQLVPLGAGTTFEDLADKTGLPVKKLTRVLRHAITEHIFCEPRPGHIKHSIASKALVAILILPTWCEMAIYEVGPAKMRTVDAIAKWPHSEEPNQCGYNLAHGTDKTMFEFFEDNPERASRFKTAMNFLGQLPGLENSYVVQGFDWASLGKGTVVDVGGSHGQVSIDIAKEYYDLHFVVQDLPKVINDGQINVPAKLADRVKFMEHDFFTEQPVKGAQVYYFRWILHDWSDKYCIRILKALIPALVPGARLVLSERCLEAPCTLPLRQEGWNRNSDITMLATSNSQERDEGDWVELFNAASPRFTLEEVKRIPGAKLDIIVFRWD